MVNPVKFLGFFDAMYVVEKKKEKAIKGQKKGKSLFPNNKNSKYEKVSR